MKFEDFTLKGKFRVRSAAKRLSYGTDVPSPMDLSREHQLYGKVDRLGSAVRLMVDSSDALSYIPKSNNVFVINFIARAFVDLKRDYEKLVGKGALQPFMGMTQLNPISGWNDFYGYYNSNIDALREHIKTKCMLKFDNHIRDLGDFVRVCFQILKEADQKYIVTATGMMMSRRVPNSVSGLIINLSDNNASQEELKADLVDGENFKVFANKCGQYGFRLNRETPWTLIANLGSGIMSTYGEPSGLSLDSSGGNFFERYYVKMHLEELDRVRFLFVQMYNDYIKKRPIFRKIKYSKDGKKQNWQYRRKRVESPSEYDIRFWFEVLFKLRLMETDLKQKIRQEDFDNVIDYCLRIEERTGIEIALNHLNQAVKNLNLNTNIFYKNMDLPLTKQKLNHIILSIHK